MPDCPSNVGPGRSNPGSVRPSKLDPSWVGANVGRHESPDHEEDAGQQMGLDLAERFDSALGMEGQLHVIGRRKNTSNETPKHPGRIGIEPLKEWIVGRYARAGRRRPKHSLQRIEGQARL